MTIKNWPRFSPSLLLAAGIVVSTLIAVLTADSGWWVLSAPLVLSLTIVAADLLDSRLRGAPSSPSSAALILGSAFLVAGVIVTLSDPSLVKVLIPIIGAGSYAVLLQRPRSERRACSGI